MIWKEDNELSDIDKTFPCRPGVTRLSFPYFMNRDSTNYVVKAFTIVAKHGWKLLPQVITFTCLL